MKVQVSEDGRQIMITGRKWFEKIPAELLPGRLKLCRQLRDRAGGRYASYYTETVSELEAAARSVAAGAAKSTPNSAISHADPENR